MALYVASIVSLCLPHFVEVRTLSMLICFVCFGCGQVYVSAVSLGSNVSPSIFGCVVMGSVYLKSKLCSIFCWVRGE